MPVRHFLCRDYLHILFYIKFLLFVSLVNQDFNFFLIVIFCVKSSFQIAGWNNISSGNNSKRPASISNIITSLEKSLKNPKLQSGPTIESPGPILLIVAATAVKFVTRSCPSKDMAKTETTKIIINVIKYTLIERTTSCSIGLPSILIFLTLFG